MLIAGWLPVVLAWKAVSPLENQRILGNSIFAENALSSRAETFSQPDREGRVRLFQRLRAFVPSPAPRATNRPEPVVLPDWSWDGNPQSFADQLKALQNARWLRIAFMDIVLAFWDGFRNTLDARWKNRDANALINKAQPTLKQVRAALQTTFVLSEWANDIAKQLTSQVLPNNGHTEDFPTAETLGLADFPVPIQVYFGPDRTPLEDLQKYKTRYGQVPWTKAESLTTLNGTHTHTITIDVAISMVLTTLLGNDMRCLRMELQDQGYGQVAPTAIRNVDLWLIKKGSVGHIMRIAVDIDGHTNPALIVGQVANDPELSSQRITIEWDVLRHWHDTDSRERHQRQVVKPSLTQDVMIRDNHAAGTYKVMLGSWEEGYYETHVVWVNGRSRILVVKKWTSPSGPRGVLLSAEETDAVWQECARLRAFYGLQSEGDSALGVFAFNDGPFVVALTAEDHLRYRTDKYPDVKIVSVSGTIPVPNAYVPIALALEFAALRDDAGDARQAVEIGYWAHPHLALQAFVEAFLDRRLNTPHWDHHLQERNAALRELQALLAETQSILLTYPNDHSYMFSFEIFKRYKSILEDLTKSLDLFLEDLAAELARLDTEPPHRLTSAA